ncbi:MAG: hypothetical protein HQ523_03710 [Lentisphaerae bacterium]|nr:hypothetical protein [Lentisphaerota bacterium]
MNHKLRNMMLPAAAGLLVVGALWLNAQEMIDPASMPPSEDVRDSAAPIVPPIPTAPDGSPMLAPDGRPTTPDAMRAPALAAPAVSIAPEPIAEAFDTSDEASGFLTLDESSDSPLDLQEADAAADKISITLDDVEILDVVRMFTRISGANIIATPSNLNGRVTVNLTDVEWKPALESILDMHGLALDEKLPGSGVYRIVPRPAGSPEPMKVETFFLSYAAVANVSPVVTSMLAAGGTVSDFPSKNALVVRSTAANLGEIQQVITEIDTPRDQVFIEAKFMELNDQAIKDLGINWQALSGYSIGASSLQVDLRKSRVWEDQRSDALARRDLRGATDTLNERYDIYNDQYEEQTLEFLESPPDSGNFISQTTITPTRETVDSIDAGADVLSDVSRAFTKSISDARTAVLSAADFQVVLSALKQMSGISVVSNPKIIVANEEIATIHIGQTERPFISSVTPGQQGIAPVVTYNPGEPVDLGVKLTVTPTVNTSSNITVKIEPELTRFLRDAEAPNGQTYPIIATKKITTIFSLDSGKTVAIGGLTETTDREVTSKIPLLGSIPILGKYLFSHTHQEKSQEETIIFVSVGLAMPDSILRETGLPEDTELTRRHLIAAEAKRRAFLAEMDQIQAAAKADRERDSSEETSKLLKRR